MPSEERDGCFTPAELVDYFDHNLPEDQALRLEEHLTECDHCSNLAREVYALSAKWGRWTARTHAEAYAMEANAFRALLQRALEKIGGAISRQAVESWKKGAEGAVRVVMREIAASSEIMTEGVESLLRPQASWSFAPVAVSPRGSAERVQGASASVQVETPESCPGGRRARVGIDAAARRITVAVENHPAERPYPRVLLVPLQEGVEPEVGKWTSSSVPGSKTVDLYTQFSGRKPGEYLIAFEPTESLEEKDG